MEVGGRQRADEVRPDPPTDLEGGLHQTVTCVALANPDAAAVITGQRGPAVPVHSIAVSGPQGLPTWIGAG